MALFWLLANEKTRVEMFRLCVTAEKVTFSRKVFKPEKDPFGYVDIAAMPVIKSMYLERANVAHHLVSLGEK